MAAVAVPVPARVRLDEGEVVAFLPGAVEVLPPGARCVRDRVRLAPASRRRTGGLIHIEHPPLVLDGVRLDFTVSAFCGTGLAPVEQRWIGARRDATCRRCRNRVRQLTATTKLVFPLWSAAAALTERRLP